MLNLQAQHCQSVVIEAAKATSLSVPLFMYIGQVFLLSVGNSNYLYQPDQISSPVRSLSSNLASLISVTVCFPLEVVKTRMQIQVRTLLCLSPASSFQLQGGRGVNHFGLSSLLLVAKQEGLKGLYRGYSVTAFCSPMFNPMY